MAKDLANYAFLPWLRQGVSSQIVEKDTYGASDGTTIERAQLNVKLTLKKTDAGEDALTSEVEVSKTIKVNGPADVIGISNRAIIRTEPKRGVTNFEANSLAYIEFYEEDFPWRYTPASPGDSGNASKRLRPWLALIVLAEGEYTLTENKNGLPSIKIEDGIIENVLHSEKDTWAWAHMHMNHTIDATSAAGRIAEVTNELEADADDGVSRLLCPRKLHKETKYQAFLIPAFETGRLAGLGLDPAGVKAQMPSWKKGGVHNGLPRPFEFPIYYRWNFNTGRYGDFESLVSMLKPVIIKPELGKRPMDIQSPGFGLNQVAKSKMLGMEGALKPPAFQPDEWPDNPATVNGDDQEFINRLQHVLNLSYNMQEKDVDTNSMSNPFYSADIGDAPMVPPPLYGQWHALSDRLPAPNGKKWFNTLNLDPRNRAAAGLGTHSIQEHQEKLMHQAWMQIGEVNAANQKIREAELAKQVNKKVFKKHLARAKKDFLINKTSFVHGKLKLAANTIKQEIKESRVPLAAVAPAFKKMTRPGKKFNKVLNKAGSQKIQDDLITNFNKGTGNLTAAKLKQAPLASVTMSMAQASLDTVINNYVDDPKNIAKEVFFNILQPAPGASSVPGDVALKNKANNASFNGAPIAQGIKNLVHELIDAIKTRSISNGKAVLVIKGEVFESFFGAKPEKYLANVVLKNENTVENGSIAPTVTLGNLITLQTNFNAFTGVAVQLKAPAFKAVLPSVENVAVNIKAKLNPGITIQNRALQNIKIWSVSQQRMVSPEKLKPIMAYPRFEKPVFEYIKKISQDYIMPNIDQVKKNSITIVQTNQKFIEAYMAGLNHEMSRELLWREYPTDQRGTYFRQFWDIKDDLRDVDAEEKLDIKEMHTWSKDLGKHQNRTPSQGVSATDDGYLVLLIRGDVFKKYPNTMVYAQKAIYDPDNKKKNPRTLPQDLDKDVMYPLFTAELEPDVYLFGFDLSIEKARGQRGNENPANNPGYFFVLRERPGQIRFGLDDYTDELGNTDLMPPAGPLESWNDLSWEHTVNNKQALESYHLDFKKNLTIDAPPPGEPHALWKSNSADLAWILYQNPVLFARHAGEMLPED